VKVDSSDIVAPVSTRVHKIAWLVACVIVFAWGINFVFAKHALNQLDVGPFNFLRFTGMVILGWLVVIFTRGLRPIQRSDWLRVLLVALVGFCGYVFGFSVGLHLTSAFSASLMLALVPLWIIVLTAVQQRRLPNWPALFALLLAAAGCAIFVASRVSVSLGWGDLISLLVAGCYAGYLLLNRPLVARYPPLTLTTYFVTLAAMPILAATAPTLSEQDWTRVDNSGWLAMTWLTIVPVFVAWSVWIWVERHLATTKTSPLLFLVPVVSGLTAWLLLDETIEFGQIVGTAAVIVGLIINQRTSDVFGSQKSPG
jgi:drug/metabolite transporter (DMT)-like permease